MKNAATRPSDRIREIADKADWTDSTLLLVLLDALDDGPEGPEDAVRWCERVATDEASQD